MIGIERAARGFAAVGSEPRLDLLLTLVRAGDDGLTVGEIQERTDMPPSTLAHHLKSLSTGGLIDQIRKGRLVINRASYDHIEALAGFLLRECCADAKSVKGTQRRAAGRRS